MKFDDNILRLESLIRSWLERKGIITFSVYLTLEVPPYNQGLCSISFYDREQLQELLDLLEYNVQCNKNDFIILDDYNTLLLTGLALVKLYNEVV